MKTKTVLSIVTGVLLVAAVLVGLVLALISTPRKTTRTYLKDLQKKDIYGAAALTTDPDAKSNQIFDLSLLDEFGHTAKQFHENLGAKLTDFDWSIVKCEKQGDTATVTVKVDTYSFEKLIDTALEYLSEHKTNAVDAMAAARSHETASGAYETLDPFFQELDRTLAGLTEKNAHKEVRLTLKKTDGVWKLQPPGRPLFDAV